MKSLTLQLRITGKRLESLKLLSRSLDDPKKLTNTARKLLTISIDKAAKAVNDCIQEARGENEECE